MSDSAATPRHSTLCAINTTGHTGPCDCGADPRGIRGVPWLIKKEPKS